MGSFYHYAVLYSPGPLVSLYRRVQDLYTSVRARLALHIRYKSQSSLAYHWRPTEGPFHRHSLIIVFRR